ncbi:MAG: thiol reductase thioredoxin, partial [Clostridia bacterium]|nr:thiol reductase thioredoxin [Clostridia bacterium]
MITELTLNNFEEEAVKSDKPVLIDFWATWCGPCRMLSPIVDEIAEERTDIKVCKVNVDNENELAAKFGVM